MLGKLIKNELKFTVRIFGTFYLSIFIIVIVDKLLFMVDTNNLYLSEFKNFLAILYTLGIVASILLTIALIIMSFYRTMLKEEGYLTFTLPVTVSELLISKIITGAIWLILNGITIFVSMLILFWDIEFINDTWRKLVETLRMGKDVNTLIAVIIVMVVISAFAKPIIYFCAMAIGQLFNTHKIIGSLVGYFIINLISHGIGIIVLLLISHGEDESALITASESNLDFNTTINYLISIFSRSTITILILAIFAFFVTRYLFTKKLNLD